MERKENIFKRIAGKLSDKQKRTAAGALLLAVIVAVGVINYYITITPDEPAEDQAVFEDSFAVFRREKNDSRAQQISYIDSVFQDTSASEEMRQQASEQKLELAANMEAETAVEGMIRTTMQADCVVTVSASSVSVVIDRAKLTDAEAAQIAQIVTAQTGQAANNIKIMPQEKNNVEN